MTLYRNILFPIFAGALTLITNSYADSDNNIYDAIRNTQSLSGLIKYLNTNDINQIRYVIRMIARSKEPSKIKYLKSLWLYQKLPIDANAQDKYIHPSTKLMLAQVLLSIDKPEHQYRDYIKQQANSKDWKVLSNAAEALIYVDDLDAVRLLTTMCRSDNMLVASNAARSLVIISKNGKSKILAKKEIDHLLQSNQIKFKKVIAILANKDNAINKHTTSNTNRPISKIDSIIQTYLVKNKYKDAIDRLLPIAKNGNPQAQYILGEIYLSGPENIRDYKQAIFWLELSSNQNNNAAKFSLANAYLSGRGVSKNKDAAIELLESAASSSYRPAIQLLDKLKH